MNYKKLYDNIISKAKTRPISGYTERHHIVPKSFGGTDKKDNIVRLTAREHFICHYLLCKITVPKSIEWYSAIKAFNMMCSKSNTHQRYINSRLYQSMRQHMSITMSNLQSGSKNSQYGSCWINKEGIVKKIPQEYLTTYEQEGWQKGRKPPKPPKVRPDKPLRILKRPQSSGVKNSQFGSYWINNGKDNKKIRSLDIPSGWTKGRLMKMIN